MNQSKIIEHEIESDPVLTEPCVPDEVFHEHNHEIPESAEESLPEDEPEHKIELHGRMENPQV